MDETFIFAEAWLELQPLRSRGGSASGLHDHEDVKKSIQAYESDGNGGLLTLIHPKMARCANCSMHEDDELRTVLVAAQRRTGKSTKNLLKYNIPHIYSSSSCETYPIIFAVPH
jgi:hypothetical protein